MARKRCLNGKSKRKLISPEDEYPKSANFLMTRGFPLILCNMIFGLLPITISGNKVRHSFCSLSTIFSAGAAVSLIFLSYVFAPLSIYIFLQSTVHSQADIIAIAILKVSHIVGFLILLLNSHRTARRLPQIWKDLVTCFHLAVIEVYGDNWRKLRKLQRFSRLTFIIYVIIIIIHQVSQASKVMEDLILFFNLRVAPLRTPPQVIWVIAGEEISNEISTSSVAAYDTIFQIFCLQVMSFGTLQPWIMSWSHSSSHSSSW